MVHESDADVDLGRLPVGVSFRLDVLENMVGRSPSLGSVQARVASVSAVLPIGCLKFEAQREALPVVAVCDKANCRTPDNRLAQAQGR